MRKEVKTFQFESCFVTYWSLCGIPEEQEGIALDGIFQRLVSPDVKVHSKSQIVPLLFKLSQKYPEIKPELISCLEDQLDKNSKAFKTKVLKYLQRLKSSKFD